MSKNENKNKDKKAFGFRREYVIRQRYRFLIPDDYGEFPEGESQTVPGETYTISELLDRFRRGLASDAGHPQYDADDGQEDVLMDVTPWERPSDLIIAYSEVAESIKQQQQKQNETVSTGFSNPA